MSDQTIGSTRRERRSIVRKRQIIEAAASVFAEKGYEGATNKEIAKAADIAEGTIYNYFKNRDDLVISMIEYLTDVMRVPQMLDQTKGLPLQEAMSDFFRSRIEANRPHIMLLYALLPEIMSSPTLRHGYYERMLYPIMKALEEHFAWRVEQGELVKVKVDQLARLLVSFAVGTSVLHIVGEDKLMEIWQQPDEMSSLLARLFFEGLAPDNM